MNEKPNYYAIIPANVRYDTDLRPNAKLLYGEITALSSKYGVCTASNNYFATLYEVDSSAISKWITQLKNKKYIDVEYQKNGGEIKQRIIKIIGSAKYQYLLPKDNGGYCQKDKENNTRDINNTSKKEIYKERNFIKPTLEEVKEYCLERQNGIDAEQFIDFYESKGWLVGKSKMKDWKACIRTWERNNKSKQEDIDLPDWFNKDLNKEFEEQHNRESIEEIIKELEE